MIKKEYASETCAAVTNGKEVGCLGPDAYIYIILASQWHRMGQFVIWNLIKEYRI